MPYIQLTISDLSLEDYQLLLNDIAETPFNGIEELGEKSYIIYYADTDWHEDYEHIITKYTPHVQKDIIGDENWNATWEAQFDPVLIDNFCYIKAPFHPENDHVTHTIHLSPKMSFGTGHHATTKQMIEMMKNIDFNNKEVFDFGTGTGILAVLAEKLGAKRVLGNDVDTWSIVNAQETVTNNSCSRIDIVPTDIVDIEDKFDIVLANINRHILLQYMSNMHSMLSDNGILLLSGIFEVDLEMIIQSATEQGFKFESSTVENNWTCARFRK